MRLHLNVDYVDLITEPGPDDVIAARRDAASEIYKKVRFSVRAHNPVAIAVAGHFDCLANAASREEHLNQIRKAVGEVQSWGGIRVMGLWVNEWGWIDLIVDTGQKPEPVSYPQYPL